MLPGYKNHRRTERFRLHALGFILGLFFALLGAGNATADPPQGDLKIEGDDILRLEFHGKGHVVLDQLGATNRLRAGKYQSVKVTVGKTNSPLRFTSTVYQAIEVTTNKMAVLRFGGPLTNHVTVVQQGRTLRLDYQLMGALGQSYLPEDTRLPPRFQVSRNGKTLASGSFEFG